MARATAPDGLFRLSAFKNRRIVGAATGAKLVTAASRTLDFECGAQIGSKRLRLRTGRGVVTLHGFTSYRNDQLNWFASQPARNCRVSIDDFPPLSSTARSNAQPPRSYALYGAIVARMSLNNETNPDPVVANGCTRRSKASPTTMDQRGVAGTGEARPDQDRRGYDPLHDQDHGRYHRSRIAR